jgi:hypothetical protein
MIGGARLQRGMNATAFDKMKVDRLTLVGAARSIPGVQVCWSR